MKTTVKFAAILLILAGGFYSCGEEDGIDMSKIDFTHIENLYEQPLPVIQKAVQGRWKIYQTCGGVVGCTYPENSFITITANEIIWGEGDIYSAKYSWKKRKIKIKDKMVDSYVLWQDDAEDETVLKGNLFMSIKNDSLHYCGVSLATDDINYVIFNTVSVRIR
jgi:hypothetical protein